MPNADFEHEKPSEKAILQLIEQPLASMIV